MANLSGQNIGTNYKGILNLNTLNGNLSGTLQAVTDGDGNASPLRLSTTSVDINSALTVLNSVTASGGFRSINYNESFQRVGFNNGANFNVLSYIRSSSAGVIVLLDNTEATFSRLNFGGTTNAFPAIKRNGAAIDFRLADDSGFCNVNMGQATFGGGNGYIGINNASSIDSALRNVRTNSGSSPLSISTGEVGVGDVTTYASAIFAIGSTTRGFLPPRMTEAQRDLISAPAAGLIVYNTTTNLMNFFNGTIWMAF
jgi:hypothetical protein